MNIKRNIIFSFESRKKKGVPIVENVPIRMRVVFASQRIEFTTGYRIDAAKWDADKQRVRAGCTNKLKQSASEINTQKLKGAGVNATTAIADGVSSLLGGNKVKRLEAENENLKQDITNLQKQVQAEQREQKKMETRHCSEINKIDRSYQQKIIGYNNQLKQIDTYFPDVKELLPIAEQCREVGFTEEMTRLLVNFQPVRFNGKLYSREHREKFRTEHSTAIVERTPQEKSKFRLCIDGMPILKWFKMKFEELKEKLGVSRTQKEESKPKRGLRM